MNVIVVITDSLRADHVGCYGNPWIQTPNIDRFAGEATLFEQAYSEGLPTMPTRTAFWTGRYTFPFRGWQPFELDDVLLAEVLWDQGFTSALITDVYHMHKPRFNCGRGFDYVQFIRGQEYDPFIVDPTIPVDLTERHKLRVGGDDFWKERFEQYLRNISGWNWWKSDEDHFVAQVVKAGIQWLETRKGQDHTFLWLDCFDPHEPWDPPEPYNRMYCPDYQGKDLIDPVPGFVEGYLTDEELRNVKAQYAGEVTMLDKWIGIFFDELRRMGYFDNSLIIYTTDHGEPFGEHGIVRKARPWPYEELSHIPFILRHPEGVGHGTQVDALIQTSDLMPTILDFLHVKGPEGMHGKSLLPLVSDGCDQHWEYAYSGMYGRSWSIKNHDWSYYLWLDGSEKERPELYDRKTDVGEQVNLSDQEPELADHLELQMRRFVADLLANERQ